MARNIMFRLVAILLLITKHTFGQVSSICAQVPSNNYVRNSLSCNSYNQCINGRPIFGECPRGFSFSPLTQMCDYNIAVNCRLCSPFGIQNIAEPDSCSTYYRCANGLRTTMVCPNGLLFDRKIGDCNIAERVVCETKNTICEPFAWLGTIVIGNPMDCSSYYYCVNGRAVEAVCPTDQFYNPYTAICEPRGNFCQGIGPIITTPLPLPTTREPTQPTQPAATTSVRIVYMKATTTVPVINSTTRASTTSTTTTTTTTRSTTITTSTPATFPPDTEPPATDPPDTEPPTTDPPETEPTATDPPDTEPPATPAPLPVLTCEAGVTGYFPFPPPNNCIRYYYCSRGVLRQQLTCYLPQFFTPGGDRCTDNVPPGCEYLLQQIDDV